MKRYEAILRTGIWLPPLTYFVMRKTGLASGDLSADIPITILPTLIMAAEYYSEYRGDGGKRKAQHPDVTSMLSSKKPPEQSYLLGRFRGKYISMPYDNRIGGNKNILIVGSSGSGKSSCCIISSILDAKNYHGQIPICL